MCCMYWGGKEGRKQRGLFVAQGSSTASPSRAHRVARQISHRGSKRFCNSQDIRKRAGGSGGWQPKDLGNHGGLERQGLFCFCNASAFRQLGPSLLITALENPFSPVCRLWQCSRMWLLCQLREKGNSWCPRVPQALQPSLGTAPKATLGHFPDGDQYQTTHDTKGRAMAYNCTPPSLKFFCPPSNCFIIGSPSPAARRAQPAAQLTHREAPVVA